MEPRTTSGTYAVERSAIGPDLVDAALRRIHLELLEKGASAEVLSKWLWATHWFPGLCYHDDILALATALPPEWRTGTMCDPQILLQFPHTGPEPEITFHVDQEPEWAAGRRYLRIVGIALSPWTRANGALLVRQDDETVAVELDPGDAVMMTPDLQHSGGVNHTGSLRYAVYFRFLEEGGEGSPRREAELRDALARGRRR